MYRFLIIYISLLLSYSVAIQPIYAEEIKGRLVTLQYDGKRLLREFNDKLILGNKLTAILRQKDVETVEAGVLAKVDLITEKAQVVLDMFPEQSHFTLMLLSDADDVADKYMEKYGKRKENLAYYSLSENTIYISVEDTNLRVLAHEIGHAIVNLYFKDTKVPYRIHELTAQFAEKHITD